MEPSEQLIKEGRDLFAVGRYAEAEDRFTAARSIGTVKGQALYGLGLLRYQRGEYPEASELFADSLREDRLNPNAYFYMGKIEGQLDRIDNAVKFYASALAVNPNHQGARDELNTIWGQDQPRQTVNSPNLTTGPNVATQDSSRSDQRAYPPRNPRSERTRIGIVLDARQQPVPTVAGPASALRWDIEVEEHDRDGFPLGPFYVYMLGLKISGLVSRGHWVELIQEPDGEGRVRELRNLTTDNVLRSKRSIFLPGS